MPLAVAIGEVLWDLYPAGRCIGGAPANVLRHAARFGYDGILVSRVGDDTDGLALVKALSAEVRTDQVQVDKRRPTGSVSIRLDKEGRPRFICTKETAFDALEWEPPLEAVAVKAECVITGTLSQRTPLSRKTIQTFLSKTKGLVLFDVNFRGWNDQTEAAVLETLPRTDILKMNDEESRRLTKVLRGPDGGERFLRWMTDTYGIGLVAVTRGKAGCVISDGTDFLEVPGFAVKAVDTTGCGDAFCAGLLHGRLSGLTLAESAELANALGAFTATKEGAVPDYTLGTLEAFRQTGVRGTVQGRAFGPISPD